MTVNALLCKAHNLNIIHRTRKKNREKYLASKWGEIIKKGKNAILATRARFHAQQVFVMIARLTEAI